MKRNGGARAGDALILGKPLGVGVYSAALKKDALAAEDYAALIATTTRLNTPGIALGELEDVHALTDVTGFGLAGHLLEVCNASGVAAEVSFAALPFLPRAQALARAGYVTGASARNWAGYGERVTLDPALGDAERALLTDPQTSGGLLVACAPAAVDAVLSIFATQGFADARVIGQFASGTPGLHLTR